jgi:uncharacterized Rmd1/YagE family protein
MLVKRILLFCLVGLSSFKIYGKDFKCGSAILFNHGIINTARDMNNFLTNILIDREVNSSLGEHAQLRTFGSADPSLQEMPQNFSIVVWNLEKGENPKIVDDLRNFAVKSHLMLFQEAVDSDQFVEMEKARPQIHNGFLPRLFSVEIRNQVPGWPLYRK